MPMKSPIDAGTTLDRTFRRKVPALGRWKGRDRSPQRSGEWMANGTDHQSLGNPAMGKHSLAILADRSEIGPCHKPDRSEKDPFAS